MARTNTNVNNGITANTADSVQGDGSFGNPVELVNDNATPGNDQYYGTNAIGTKGFFPLPAGLTPLVSDTYININTLITGNLLVPGQFYEITDFQTIHVIPGSPTFAVHYGNVEPIILQAVSTSTFAEQVWSTLFPTDIIYYDFIDATSANPGVLIPNGNMGRISYRLSNEQDGNRSTHYDFRNCVSYHPDSLYDFMGISFPIQAQTVVINGFSTPLSPGPFADIQSFMDYFNLPGNSWQVVAPTINTSYPLFRLFSLNGNEWGNMVVKDSFGAPHTITPTLNQRCYYTFGNTLQLYPVTVAEAPDGNQLADNIHVGPSSDGWQGQVINNTIFGVQTRNWSIGPEVVNAVIAENCIDGSIKGDSYGGIVVKEASNAISIGSRLCYNNPQQAVIGFGAQKVTIGDDNENSINIPNNANNWTIGDRMSFFTVIDFSQVLTLSNRKVETGFSNMDLDINFIASAHAIDIPFWCGIANIINTTPTSNRLDKIGKYPTLFNFKVMPKLAYFTFAPASTIAVGDLITGTLLGGTGQIIGMVTVNLINHWLVETFTGTFIGETTITSGPHSATIAIYATQSLNLDPAFCDPSVGGTLRPNIKLNDTSAPVLLDSTLGEYMDFNVDNYDQVNVYQINT